jgi:hypothetical protein
MLSQLRRGAREGGARADRVGHLRSGCACLKDLLGPGVVAEVQHGGEYPAVVVVGVG